MKATLAMLWTNAAYRESARVGAAEIDIDHLYLGLLALGGAAARLLGRHGVSLNSARQRVRETEDADLAALGIDPGPGVPPRPLLDLGDPRLRWTPRGKTLFDDAAKAPDTYAALVALLKEETGTIRRLLVADDVAPNDLVPELKQGDDDPYAPEHVRAEPGRLPAPARAMRLTRFVSVAPDAVADALEDSGSLTWWAYSPDSPRVEHDGEQVTFHHGRRTLVLRYHVTRRIEGEAIVVTWIAEAVGGKHGGEAILHDRFEIRPAPGGSDLIRTSTRRTFGVLGRIFAGLNDRFAGWGVIHTTQAIAYGAAEYRPG